MACPANTLLVSRSPAGPITGTLTLVMFPIPTGMRAWIEDVVVDESARGQGAGVALTREALRLARAAGARTVDLTSRPSREAAGLVYERIGFEIRSSRLYRFNLAGAEPRPAPAPVALRPEPGQLPSSAIPASSRSTSERSL